MKTSNLSQPSYPSPHSTEASVRHWVSQGRINGHWLAAALIAALTAAIPCQASPPAGLIASPAGDAVAKSIPFDQLGAEAQKQYAGDGIGITPTVGGARLRAAFQDLAAEAAPDGLWLESTADKDAGKPARFRVRAVAIGREGITLWNLIDTGHVRTTGEATLYLRPGLVEEYSVSMDGVRQDFVLPQRPAGIGQLSVELDVDGARAETATSGVKLTLDGSGREIAYSRLHVADANGRELSARLQVTDAGSIQVQVDDSIASYPIRIDPTFSDADWVGLNPGIPGVNSSVSALAVDSAGHLYAAGDFTFAGTVEANRIAKWDGSNWSALGSGMNDSVYALAVDAVGNLYAGGWFTSAGGVAANYIAKWNGTVWSALGDGMSGSVDTAGIYALAVRGTDLYAGGNFTTAGVAAAKNIAKWNGSAWSALGMGIGTGLEDEVYALALDGAGILYAGGHFTKAGSVTANYIAKWNGSGWSTLGAGMDYDVYALTVNDTNQLYVGGWFTTAGPVAANNIAKWGGSAWSALGTGLGGSDDASVTALAVSGADLYAGGSFTTADGGAANYIAKWNGSNWSALGPRMDYPVDALAPGGAGQLYGGGDFFEAGGVNANYIAKWNGSAWSALGMGMNNEVFALTVDGAGDLYVGGYFTTTGVVEANYIAKWNGSTWEALGSGMNGEVYALALDSAGHLYAGGNFTTAGGVTANSIAKWDGSAWSALASGMNSLVYALALDSAGHLYAGGVFTTAGGLTANYIAKWDGSAWSALGTGMSVSEYAGVYALAVSGADLYAAGNFITAGNVTVNHIAKWSNNSWTALGTGMSTEVNALALDDTGQLYAGGNFTTAGGVAANYVAKWDGGAWSALGAGMNDYILALALDGTGHLYAGGIFTTAGGVEANRIAKWDGSAWSALGSGMNDYVSALAVDGAGHLYAGGWFTTVGTTVSPYIARANLLSPLESWRLTWYGTTSNTGDAADLADPYHTGIPNLMVFAFLGPDQDPELASLSQLPASQSGSGNYFISFSQPEGVRGVTYGAQWSLGLEAGSWQPIGDTGIPPQHLFSLPMAGRTRAFIRLTVSDP